MLLLVGSGRALGLVCWIRPCAEITVGRKDATLTIEGDHSVSRRHAVLIAGGPDDRGFRMTDAGSKFGLELNKEKLASGATANVCPDDTIQFGAQGSVFKVQPLNISLFFSKMSQESQQHVSEEAKHLGFGIADSIADCTHVVMPIVSVTRALLRSLVLGRRIVNPEFVLQAATLGPTFRASAVTAESMARYVDDLEFLPLASLPPMAEDNSVALNADMLRPNGERRELFRSKMFLFADEAQHEHFKQLVADAGGCSGVLDDAKQVQHIIAGSSFASVCLVLPPDSGSDTGKRICDIAHRVHLRPISESEIGLSILLASTVEHTNPAFAEAEPPTSGNPAAETHDMPLPEDSVVASTAPVRSKRRRAAPRISNFWSSIVSSSVVSPDQTQTADPPLVVPESPPPANSEQPESADNSGPGHEKDSIVRIADPVRASAPKFRPSVTDISTSLDDLALQPGPLVAVIPVPLVKTRPAATLLASNGLVALPNAPNYKRFKKTVHTYQY